MRYGFSEKLGPVVYGNDQHQVFLGRDYTNGNSYSENVAAEIDAEIRSIIEDAFVKAEDILNEHMNELHLIAKYLMKYEKIDGDNFYKLMRGEITEADIDADDETEKADEIVAENAENTETTEAVTETEE